MSVSEQELRDALALAGLSSRSTYIYVRKLQTLQDFLLAHGASLHDCVPSLVAAFAETTPKTRSTRIQYRTAFRHFCVAVGRNPTLANAIYVPKKSKMVCRALDDGPARRLYQTAVTWDAGPEGLAVLFGMQMALRRFEIAKVAWPDIHIDMLDVMGKSSHFASIPLHPTVARRLDWWQRQTPDHVHCRPGSHWIFEGKQGRPVCPTLIWNWVRTVSDAAGIGSVPTHVLRHTALAYANDATGDLRAVQELARHKDPEVTAGYTRVTKQRMVATMMAVDYGPDEVDEVDEVDELLDLTDGEGGDGGADIIPFPRRTSSCQPTPSNRGR